MTSTIAKAIPRKHLCESKTLTVAEVRRSMRKINSSKQAAQQFLKRIGVSVSKNGQVKVKPI